MMMNGHHYHTTQTPPMNADATHRGLKMHMRLSHGMFFILLLLFVLLNDYLQLAWWWMASAAECDEGVI